MSRKAGQLQTGARQRLPTRWSGSGQGAGSQPARLGIFRGRDRTAPPVRWGRKRNLAGTVKLR